METIKDKRLTALDETVKIYSKPNTRAVAYKGADGLDACEYITDDGRKCAVGRLVSDEQAIELENIGVVGVDDDDTFDLLPNNVRKLGQHFLIELQDFHDIATHWGANGLTDKGKERYDKIKKEYC